MKINDKKEITLKQKVFLYFYKSQQYFYDKWFCVREKTKKFIGSLFFYFIFLGVLVFLLHKILIYSNPNIPENNLYSFALATAGIIGSSIVIIFSFSTFILQRTADLFSTQYLKKFIEDPKENIFFWLLVLLMIASFFAPIFLKKYVLEMLVIFLFIAFYLIYTLYNGLKKRIDPETTLTKIKDDALKQLEKINKGFINHAHFQNNIFKYKGENKNFLLEAQYKANPNWHLIVLENVKYLFEIGLRLLAKNEINSFNLTLRYICDIYLRYLDLRNGCFIRIPASFWGACTFDDEGFTERILEYLQSIGNRIIQEERKENIYFLLKIYEDILCKSLIIKYADENLGVYGDNNPLLNLVLIYYMGFIEKLLKSKENDWIWESIKSVSNVSNIILQKTDNYFVCSQINQIISKIFISCLAENQQSFLEELVNIYFNQIKIAWDKYEHNDIFWESLFEELKKNVLLLSVTDNLGLSVSNLFKKFWIWQVYTKNRIFGLKEEKEQKENLDKFIKLLKRWSDFLSYFVRNVELENEHAELLIIQLLDDNLKIVYEIKNKFKGIDLDEI